MSNKLASQSRRFYDVFAKLARSYQHRDSNRAQYFGLSVSQTHVLEYLDTSGPLKMSELAQKLVKTLSGATRIVDPLVTKRLVRRRTDTADRRICRVEITHKGQGLIEKTRGTLADEYRSVLSEIPASHRESAILVVELMLERFEEREVFD
ncbi:MAG: MarR family transcriptional regulator [Pseudomonadota bacterium]